jgi:hypothetical protein
MAALVADLAPLPTPIVEGAIPAHTAPLKKGRVRSRVCCCSQNYGEPVLKFVPAWPDMEATNKLTWIYCFFKLVGHHERDL